MLPLKSFISPKAFAVLIFGILFTSLLFSPAVVQAGTTPACQPGVPMDCSVDDDCHGSFAGDCPLCYVCDTDTNSCVPNDSICEGELDDMCLGAVCLDNPPANPAFNPLGCGFFSEALEGDASLDELCYYCDPAEIPQISTCGNGICDPAIEDCTSCPEDCVIPGFDGCTDTNGVDCTNLRSICEDGDVCTFNLCVNVSPTTGFFTCQTEPASCSNNNSDLCCPSGCTGPGVGGSCDPDDTTCDIDCWPPLDCGNDGVVQAPETCDDSVPGSNAGFRPDGSLLPDSDCRDNDQDNPCTFCGDNIIDSPSEQCDGTAANLCDVEGCNNTTCQCVGNLVQGSGQVFNCSFHGTGGGTTPKYLFIWVALGLGWLVMMGFRRWVHS